MTRPYFRDLDRFGSGRSSSVQGSLSELKWGTITMPGTAAEASGFRHVVIFNDLNPGPQILGEFSFR